MVDDRITDGKRIAQLLSSELTGLDEGRLADVAVGDPNPDASPTATGTTAYTVTAGGAPFAVVSMYPERVTVTFEEPVAWPDGDERPAVLRGDRTVEVTTGAAVKRAVDAVRLALAADED